MAGNEAVRGFRGRLRGGETLLGTMLTLPSPPASCASLQRPRRRSGRCSISGAAGIVVPQVNTAEQAADVEAVDHVVETCRKVGMPLGCFGISAEAVRPFMRRGCTLIVAGVDTLLLTGAAARLLGELKAAR